MSTPIPAWMWILSAALMAPFAAGAQARLTVPLDAGWRFQKADSHLWQAVTLPHSVDAANSAGAPPYRGTAWYRRTLNWPRQRPGQRHFLEFDGAMLVTQVWINGHHAGRHAGGFARFRFDVTRWLTAGRNEIVVRVDNAPDSDVAPLGGDYSMSGGLYRPVRMITTGDVHFDMLDYGGPGVYFTPSAVSAARASLAWTARVANQRGRTVRAVVTTRLRDAGHRVVATASKAVTLQPHSVSAVILNSVLAAPRLWQGARDPYLYTSEAELRIDGGQPRSLDQLSFQTGIRDIRLDPAQGILLNGARYAVHGVNVHQTSLPGKGTAVSSADIEADYRILEELGVTGLRFAHYQHPQHAYDLADRLGWLVWTEMPLTAAVGGTQAFQANSVQQLRELIRQNSSHPSVMAWGLGNEIYKVDADSAATLALLQRLAHKEDPSRPTVYANCCGPIDGPQASHTDALGSNVYFGWYEGEFAELGPFLDANRARRPATPLSVSEYGAGAGAGQQEDPPRRPLPGGPWHPEQYQALYHEAAWRQLAARPWLWSNFIWVGFDFPSAGRNEGERPGFNDKGLVSFDRGVKKDAYFWYQANWTSRPMVYLTSRRHTQRQAAEVQVKVYSNQPGASLRLNGVDLGARPVAGRIATWQVRLAQGANRLEVSAGSATDSVVWHYQAPPAAPRN
ncbi:glycoside hydrolase family 2 protein [Massilia pseudoviolaceinigra]|uniref:glycoside hydrolase family 2 protein n=1 Tax=Massilia pseudoviolaceinigra TaxID=3057165 RepID=UPI002796B33D|nr:glycoside hydrolase family 2 TIM barrel-domain containing protein [Massilia sp. CCM 9206]MDQ1919203.1 glycoside hydrolase family 2 TIM barrel-domain containing protein [Massilia sp. CCM 9206]